MATKEDVEIFGMVLSEAVFRLTGFGPSKQVSNEFAQRILAEAKMVGYDINLGVSNR